MPKNTNKAKKTGQILIEKYEIISTKFKTRISQLIAKINSKQRRLNQIRHFLTGQNHHFFSSKNIKVFR